MKLYIASHSQEEAKAVAKLCQDAGHTITSRWLEEDFTKAHNYTEADNFEIADNDADDVGAADALVLLASPRRIPGGKFVEVGIALGQLKPVFILGHLENMMMYHHLTLRFDSAEDFLKAIA